MAKQTSSLCSTCNNNSNRLVIAFTEINEGGTHTLTHRTLFEAL